MKKNRKLFCSLTALIFIVSVFLTACEKIEPLSLVERILNGTETKPFSIDAVISVVPNKTELYEDNFDHYILSESFPGSDIDMIPEKVDIGIKGTVIHSPSPIFDLDVTIDGDSEMKFKLLSDGVSIYVSLNKYTKIISDLIYSLGYIDPDYFNLFLSKTDFTSGKYLKFNIKDIDLNYFKKYENYTDSIAKVTSKTSYADKKDIKTPVVSKEACIDFNTLKKSILTDSYKVDGKRFVHMNFIIDRENGTYYLHTAAENDSGKLTFMEKLQLNCNLQSMKRTESAFMDGEYVPLRYVAELMGKDIQWDSKGKFAYVYITSGGKTETVKFDGILIGDTTYVCLTEFLKFPDFQLYTESVDDEFIEFIIYRLE